MSSQHTSVHDTFVRLNHSRYEFFGPFGAALISFGLSIFCYVVTFFCNSISGCPAPSLLHPSNLTLEQLKQEIGWNGIFGLINTNAALATAGYYMLSLTLYTFLPASEVEGTRLRSGIQLKYRSNAFSSAVFVLAILAIETAVHGAYSPAWIFISENYVALLTIKHPNDPNGRELAAGGHTDNVIYDWFIGRELNPRINLPIFGEVDIMTWCELRPSMLGWIILDLAFIMQQYRNFGKITISILLTAVAQTIYVLDALYMEPAILTTIDVIKDGFGMMLSFGNLVWVPFTYSIQTKYLATHPVELGWGAIASIVAIQGIGYYIFRASNNEKHRFRVDPCDSRVRHLAYIETGTGSKLLITGWWGMARHINSFGDWLMSWSYVLPTALAGYEICHKKRPQNDISPTDGIYFYDSDIIYVVPGLAKGWGMLFTYFFMLYFAILLIHRERRDDALCRKKYGADWERYCVLVPYRIVPYVY